MTKTLLKEVLNLNENQNPTDNDWPVVKVKNKAHNVHPILQTSVSLLAQYVHLRDTAVV